MLTSVGRPALLAALLLLAGVLGAPAAGPSIYDQNFTGGLVHDLSEVDGCALKQRICCVTNLNCWQIHSATVQPAASWSFPPGHTTLVVPLARVQ